MDHSKYDTATCRAIATAAAELLGPDAQPTRQELAQWAACLSICHAEIVPMRLADMLDSVKDGGSPYAPSVLHDLTGIAHYADLAGRELRQQFMPRFAA